MRPIDWSPLVVLLSAIAAAAAASALPETFFLKRETAAVVIWVPLVLIVLKAIRVYRRKRMAGDKPDDLKQADKTKDPQELEQ